MTCKTVPIHLWSALMLLTTLACSGCSMTHKVEYYGIKVLEKYPHQRTAYTQGLFFHEGVLYESCGEYGKSRLRTVDL